jgi:hypothetical protein
MYINVKLEHVPVLWIPVQVNTLQRDDTHSNGKGKVVPVLN